MLYLLFLFGYDSLPPLPDLSKINLPEPVLWIQPARRGLLLDSYAGQFYGAGIDLDLHAFRARGQFMRDNEWDSTDMGSAQINAKITLPRIWIEPHFDVMLLRRRDDYTRLTPGLGLAIFTSPVVMTGTFDYHHWLKNNEPSSEATGDLSFIFDRMTFFPSMTVRGIYTGKRLKPSLFAKLHIGSFRLELGSPVRTGFPSPVLCITYADPWIEAAAGVQTGVKHNTLVQYFKPELPTKYGIDIPSETTKVVLDLGITLRIRDHSFTVGGAYKEWLYRLTIGEDYETSTMRDVKETNLRMCARNSLRFGLIDLDNSLVVQYNTSDSAITFLPDIGIIDTFALGIGGLELSAEFRYLSQRNGVGKSLPHCYILNTQVGFRLYFAKLYFAVHNITDEKSEIYDDYFFTGRQYAGGLEIKQAF
jgi:hypothetical protein